MRHIISGSRDHGRVCMMWDESEYYGFGSEGWLMNLEENPQAIVSKQIKKKDSIYHFTKSLIQLKKEEQSLIYGNVIFIAPKQRNVFVYQRDDLLIEMNLVDRYIPRSYSIKDFELIFSNVLEKRKSLVPYEFNIYRRVK